MGITDKAKEKAEEADQERQSSSTAEKKQTRGNQVDPTQGGGDAEQAPNPTKAAEDAD